jgi:hypothetical protein
VVSRAFGDAWLESKTMPAMLVPTFIAPGEWNVLLNPLHPQPSLKWIVSGPGAYDFDARLRPIKRKTRSRRTSRPSLHRGVDTTDSRDSKCVIIGVPYGIVRLHPSLA